MKTAFTLNTQTFPQHFEFIGGYIALKGSIVLAFSKTCGIITSLGEKAKETGIYTINQFSSTWVPFDQNHNWKPVKGTTTFSDE